MQEIIYAMEFTGGGTTPNSPDGIIHMTCHAAPCTITTAIGSGGVRGRLQPGGSGRAEFKSTVKLKPEGAFDEEGTIEFGEGHKLRFTTIREGYIAPSAQPGTMHGAVIWKVEGGEGEFEGATGLITSNFTIDPKGQVADRQFGVIYLRTGT